MVFFKLLVKLGLKTCVFLPEELSVHTLLLFVCQPSVSTASYLLIASQKYLSVVDNGLLLLALSVF